MTESAVVLLHPLGGARSYWLPVADRLKQAVPDLRVLTVDLPGHGASPSPERPVALSDFSRVVIDRMDEAGVSTATVVGVSLGGLVAQDLAVNHAHRVRRLVLADTVATYPPAMRQMWLDRAASVRSRGLEHLAQPTVDLWFSEAFKEHPVAGRSVRTLLRTPAEGYARACELLAAVDLSAVTGRIAAETLVVCGRDDAAAFHQGAAWLVSHLPNARLVEIAGRHAATLENAEEFTEVLLSFLRPMSRSDSARGRADA